MNCTPFRDLEEIKQHLTPKQFKHSGMMTWLITNVARPLHVPDNILLWNFYALERRVYCTMVFSLHWDLREYPGSICSLEMYAECLQ